jgi:hypothetical protein
MMEMANVARMTVAEQMGRIEGNRGRALAVRVVDPVTGYVVKASKLFAAPVELRKLIPLSSVEVRTPLGLLMDPSVIRLTPEEIDTKAAQMDVLFEVAAPRASQTEAVGALQVAASVDLCLLFDPESDKVAMKDEVTIGQMRQFVKETGYAPAEGSHNAREFNRLIAEGDASSPMVFTNETDCLAFAEWALVKAQAQDPRIQTLGLPSDSQWVNMRQIFGGQQTGSKWERLADNCFRSFFLDGRNGDFNRVCRYVSCTFRLVGTYTKQQFPN